MKLTIAIIIISREYRKEKLNEKYSWGLTETANHIQLWRTPRVTRWARLNSCVNSLTRSSRSVLTFWPIPDSSEKQWAFVCVHWSEMVEWLLYFSVEKMNLKMHHQPIASHPWRRLWLPNIVAPAPQSRIIATFDDSMRFKTICNLRWWCRLRHAGWNRRLHLWIAWC